MGTSATEVERLIQAARLHLAHGELHEAAGRATEAIRLDGKQAAAYLLRAEAHRRLKRPERALADLAVAIRLDPQQPGPYVIRAEIQKRRCLLDQAIADATSALMLDPRNAAAYAIRAQCRYAIGDQEGAREDVQEMLVIDPTRPVPDLQAGAVSDSSPTTAADNERFWKQAGGGHREDERALFADGKPVDRTYRSRPVVSDEDAPEALGVASGYKPETIARPIPRMSGRAKKSLGHGGGGAIVMLGVTLVAGCALWLVFRGAAGPEPGTRPAAPQSSPVVESNAPQPTPASNTPGAPESTGRGASTPVRPPDLKPVVRDLGSFSLTEEGRSWVVVMPERFTRAELAFYRGTPDHPTLNAAYAGHLQINGRDVVRFTGTERDGTFIFHDYTSDTDYRAVNDYDTKPLRRHIDVTKYLRPGENTFQYYHEQRPDLPMGVVLAITPAADVSRSEVGVVQATGGGAKAPEVGEIRRFKGHTDYVSCVAFSPDGRQVATGSNDKTIRLWDVGTGKMTWTSTAPKAMVRAVSFGPDGRTVYGCDLGGLRVLDAETGSVRGSVDVRIGDRAVFSKDGNRLLARHPDGTATVYGVPDGQVVLRVDQRSIAHGIAFTPDGQRIVYGVKELLATDLASKRRQPTGIRQSCYLESLDISLDGLLASGSGRVWNGTRDEPGDRAVRVWDLGTGRQVAEFLGHEGWLWAVAISPGGHRVLSGGSGRTDDWYGHKPGADSSIRLWDVAARRSIGRFDGHRAAVLSLAFSPDGRYAVSGSADSTARLWRLPD